MISASSPIFPFPHGEQPVSLAFTPTYPYYAVALTNLGEMWPGSPFAGGPSSALVGGAAHTCFQSSTTGLLSCAGDNTCGQSSPPPQVFAAACATEGPYTLPPTLNNCVPTLGQSAASPIISCAYAFAECPSSATSVVWVQPNATAPAYQVTCLRGWTLAMNVGNSGIFSYSSPYWTNSFLVTSGGEAKLQPFLDTPLSSIMLYNQFSGTGVAVTLPTPASSLLSLFVDGSYVPTTALRNDWVSLVPGFGAQANCNLQGINSQTPLISARIGMEFNEQNDCNTCDTAVGVGMTSYPYSGGYINSNTGTPFAISIYVRGFVPSSTSSPLPGSPTPTPSSSISHGATPSTTATTAAAASTTSTPSSSPTPPMSHSVVASPSGSPTSTLTLHATASSTATALSTTSVTPTASVSPYCNPSVFRSFVSNDLVGTLLGSVSMPSSAYGCQLTCCSTANCDGYTFMSSTLLQAGAFTAPCYLLANVTQLIPNHGMSSGIRASVFSS